MTHDERQILKSLKDQKMVIWFFFLLLVSYKKIINMKFFS
jgi:hypothetical protein